MVSGNDRISNTNIIFKNENITIRRNVHWITSIYGKRKDILVNDWAKKGYLVYMNDLDMEKTPAEMVTLQMRVSKSASAYINNIKKKSDFVNDLEIAFYVQGCMVSKSSSRPVQASLKGRSLKSFRWAASKNFWRAKENGTTEKYVENEIERQSGLRELKA